MNLFKPAYYFICWLLLATQLVFLGILAYSKIRIGRVLFFAKGEESNKGFENYFKILILLLQATFVLLVLWALLTPVAMIINKHHSRSKRINYLTGLLGFTGGVILLIIDPFGIFEWFTR